MITYRRATLSDVSAVAELFDQYRIFYQKTADLLSAIQFLSERLEKEESVVFVAENAQNNLVGFVQLYPLFSSTRMQRLWLLNDLFVHSDFRGQGVSKMLIDAAKELCRRTNACELMLETQKNNYIANQLYVHTGFTLDKEHHYYYWSE